MRRVKLIGDGVYVDREYKKHYVCVYTINFRSSNLWDCVFQIAEIENVEALNKLRELYYNFTDPTTIWIEIEKLLAVQIDYMSVEDFEKIYDDP